MKTSSSVLWTERATRLVSSSVSDLWCAWSVDGAVTWCNGPWAAFLCPGDGRGDGDGPSLASCLYPGDDVAMAAASRALEDPQGGSVEFEVRVRAGDGSYRRFAWTAVATDGVAYAVADAVEPGGGARPRSPGELAAAFAAIAEFVAQAGRRRTRADDGRGALIVDLREWAVDRAEGGRAHPASNRHQRVVECVPDALYTIDPAGGLTYASPACAELFGQDPSSLVGQVVETLMDAAQGPELLEARRLVLATGQPVTVRSRLANGDDDGGWVETTFTRLDDPSSDMAEVLAVSRDVTDRIRAEAELKLRALTDPLTGIANRALLDDRIQQALHRLERQPGVVMVLVLDLDHFKIVNDSLGHQAGDQLLVAATRRLVGTARPMDTVARLGGDEFAVLAEGLASDTDAWTLADRLVEAMRAPFHVGGEDVIATASVGVATTTQAHHQPADLVRRADLALYRAKDRGRDRTEFFDAALEVRVAARHTFQQKVRTALVQDRLRLNYQPVIELATDLVVASEAVVTVDHADEDSFDPAELAELAASTTMEAAISGWSLTTAVTDLWRWYRNDVSEAVIPVAVNIVARDLVEAGFARRVSELLALYGLKGTSLRLQLNERSLAGADASAHATLVDLRALGVKLGINEFGSGPFALSSLINLPVDFVTVGPALIANVDTNLRSEAVLAAVIDLAHGLGIQVVGRGVQTADQLSALSRLGCDLGQGSLFSPGLPHWEYGPMTGAGSTG